MTAMLAPNPSAVQTPAGKYFTFALGQESYGIPVFKVKEIVRMMKVTPLPETPEHIKGVVNLRGKVIPITDLRTKFGLATSTTDHTCIVVIHLKPTDGSPLPIGMIVDAVEEVIQVGAEDIEDAPNFSARVAPDCRFGITKVKGAVKILLDIEKAVGNEVIQLLNSAN